MEILSFRTPGLGDQTYLLTHEGQGVLVDPQRDIDRFLAPVAEGDVALRFVLETHLHNDYVSGAEQAAARTGAELVMPAAAAPAYTHTPAFHMEEIGENGLTVRPIHTPGHTPEHTSYLVLIDGEPVALFSGGSLLVGSAGRPDLLGPARARTLARLQHQSLHRLAALPRHLELLPTHGEGSFCTASGAGKYTSTVGEEADTNPLLAIPDAETFADQLLKTPMPIPAFYRFMGPANTLGVQPMPDRRVPELSLVDLDGVAGEDVHVVDIRPRLKQAEGLLPGSTAIELADDFGSWAGWLVPYNAPIVLVAERDQDVDEAVTQLAQIGVDSVRGVIFDLSGASLSPFQIEELPAFRAALAQPGAQLLDVRMPNERATVSWPGAVERFAADLFTGDLPPELDRDRPVLVACGSGRRASIAASLLVREGFRPVVLNKVGVAELVADSDRAA